MYVNLRAYGGSLDFVSTKVRFSSALEGWTEMQSVV